MDTDDTNSTVLVTVKDHSGCNNCLYKIKATLAAYPDVISVEVMNDSNITAIVTNRVDMFDIGSKLEGMIGNIEGIVRHEKPKLTLEEFNNQELDVLQKSFKSKVVNCVEGSTGRLYNSTYKGVVRVTVSDSEKLVRSQGTAFIVSKKKTFSLLLTCAHLFADVESPSIEVVTSDFKPFQATIWHKSKGLDICILKVKGDLGEQVFGLKVSRDSVNFGDDFFSVSCPVQNTYSDESYTQEKFCQTLWFSFTKGYVSHPFSVGGYRNMEAEYLQLNGCSWGHGSSGAPILNTNNGEVIGIYATCSLNPDHTRAASLATRETSVADYFVKLLKKESAEELSLMRILMQYRAERKSKKDIKLSRKREPERRGRKGKQKSMRSD